MYERIGTYELHRHAKYLNLKHIYNFRAISL
ncbi:hypothetical protein ABIE59_001808 [Marinobacter sp. MBR-99]|jgi:hypothetical protein